VEKLTEKILLKLGFKKVHVSIEESGDKPYDYFVLDLMNGICLLSNASDEAKDDCYRINLFDYPEIGICETDEEVKILYKALMRKELITT
jgi:hypothetical protein